MRQVLEDITRRVHGGASLSDSFTAYPKIFPDLFVSMIRVGETAGSLDQVLDRLSSMGTQELETKSRLMSAMIYPIVLVTFAVLLLNGLLIFVVPKFVNIFKSSEIALPVPTQILLFSSGILQRFWWLIMIAIAGCVWWFKKFYATPEGRKKVDRFILVSPGFGQLYCKIIIERMTRTLGGMLKTGVPLLEALSVTESTIPNVIFQDILHRTRISVAEGQSLAEPLSSSGFFPPLVIQLVSAGERSGQLDNMLMEIARFYEPEIDISIRKFTTVLEPVLLMGMGAMVAFIALSVLLPIFQLTKAFKK